MKVLYLNPTVAIGGAERSLVELVSGVDRQLVEPIAACIAEGPLPEALRLAGARVIINPFSPLALRIGRRSTLSKLLIPIASVTLLPHVLRLASIVRRERIRIVHTNGLKSHVMGSLAQILTGCHLVWHVRDLLEPGLTQRAYAALARLTANHVVTNSRSVAAAFRSLPSGRCSVIYNGVDTSLFSPGPPPPGLRASLGLKDEDFAIGALGALSPFKGHIHLIRALPDILRACPKAKVVIVGQEMYATLGHAGHRSVLEREIGRLGLEKRVVLAGYRDDPSQALRCFDVVVHPSIWPEAFGRVLVEAMACGIPVVATAPGGPSEIIANEDQGILIPPSNPRAIAEAVLRLEADPALRDTLATAGRARALSAFGRERYIREVEALYRAFAA